MLPKLYTSYVVTQVKQNNNTQETYYGLQPADITDYAKVGLTQEEKWELLYDFLDQRAMEGDEYAERLINEEGYDILYWDLYDFADEKMVEGNEEAARVLEKVNMRLLNLFQDDKWILRPGFKRGELNEHEESKKSRLNPDLIVGDEILVVSTDKNHPVNAPETIYSLCGNSKRIPNSTIHKRQNSNLSVRHGRPTRWKNLERA